MKAENEKYKALKAAFPYTLPILASFMFLGLTYGLLMSTKGYGAGWSFLMSSIAFCGGMQFAAIPVLAAGFNPLALFCLALVVNARHLFYGITLLSKYRNTKKLKPFLIYMMCDETFSIVCNIEPHSDVNKNYFYFFIGLLNYGYWVVFSGLGGILGKLIHFNTKGLDFALTALFTVIFIEGFKERKNRLSSVIGVVCSVVCLALFGKNQFVIPAMLCIVGVLSLFKDKKNKQEEAAA